MVSLLTLRRYEKDFILRKDTKYIEKFNQEIQTFLDKLSADSLLSASTKSTISAAIKSYDTSFKDLSDLTIGIEGEVKKLSDYYAVA